MITAFLQAYWMKAVWTVLLALMTYVIGRVGKRIMIMADRQEALDEGILSLLHDRLQQACVFYLKQGEITVKGMDNLQTMYNAYSRLGGNGTIKELYTRCREDLPIKEIDEF